MEKEFELKCREGVQIVFCFCQNESNEWQGKNFKIKLDTLTIK